MIGIFLILVLAAAVIMYGVIIAGSKNKHRRNYRPAASSRGYRGSVDPTEIRARWDLIMGASKTGASGLKSAINEGDKLVDYCLQQLGVPGNTMGERLKAAKPRFTDYVVYDGLWRAHKLRNALAHEMGFDLVSSQANDALLGFERALKSLGALK